MKIRIPIINFFLTFMVYQDFLVD